MYRVKKYLNVKKTTFMNFFNKLHDGDLDQFYLSFIIKYYYLYINPFLEFQTIKQHKINNISCQIIKELSTETWFFTCKDLIVIYINELDYPSFFLKYCFSDLYKFIIYRFNNNYIVFCISHLTSQLNQETNQEKNQDNTANILLFLLNNNCNNKHILLTGFFGPFVILNKNVKDVKFNLDNLIFDCELGYGNIDQAILYMVKYIIELKKNTKYLPINYLNTLF